MSSQRVYQPAAARRAPGTPSLLRSGTAGRSGKTRARLHGHPDGLLRRLALTIVLLIACCSQSLLIGGHVHLERVVPSSPVRAAAPSFSVDVPTASADKRDDAAGATGKARAPGTSCLICGEAALAGHYLLPLALVLAPPPAIFGWPSSEQLVAIRQRQRSHAWNSRGPPA